MKLTEMFVIKSLKLFF